MSSAGRPPTRPPTRRDFLRALALPAAAAGVASLGCSGQQDVPPGPSPREIPPPPPDVPTVPRPNPALAVLRDFRLDRMELATVFRAGAEE